MWYIPIYQKEDGTLYTGKGSDNASHSDYVRKDKVREFIAMLSEKKDLNYGNMPVEIYALPDAKFWDCEIWNPESVKKYARSVWKKR